MDGYSSKIAPDGHPIQIQELHNPCGMRVCLMDWGATWLSCQVPVPTAGPTQASNLRETLLRSPNFAEHLTQSAYFGASIGRYANRITKAQFPLGSGASARVVQLLANSAGNTLHGGPVGFDSRRWQVESCSTTKAVYGLLSQDGDQGFPGNLQVRISYELKPDNTLTISYQATTDKTCPVSLTNHAYFNLASQHDSVLTHRLRIAAQQYLPLLASGDPGAAVAAVAGSSFDFRSAKQLGQDLLASEEQRRVGGYDHAFALEAEAASGSVVAATLSAPDSSLQLQLRTTKPALQLYTGNLLAGIVGPNGSPYAKHAGVALETSFLPDAPNHPEWEQPNCVLQPGEVYAHQTKLSFT